MEHSPFHPGQDPELGELLRETYQAPEPEQFLDRLRATMSALPDRGSQWDVLAGWARPSVVVAAAAAGFLLGLALWQSWRERLDHQGASSLSVALLEPTRRSVEPIIYSVLEER